jgi:mono/diheme cytochrome c family protein
MTRAFLGQIACLGLCLVAVQPGRAVSTPPVLIQAPNAVSTQPGAGFVNTPVNPGVPTLVFDAETKEYKANPTDSVAPFTFSLTNVWTNEIVVSQVHPSCGCTTAKMPATPWHIPRGGSGQVEAKVNLEGKSGLVIKTLTFYTSVGERFVTLKVNMPPAGTGLEIMSAGERKAAFGLAQANPEIIFRGDCARCHVDKGAHALGQDLYAADCGICHESPHRASAVPDLHALKQPTDFDFWKTMITFGKPHTMMPAFAASQGGPLSEEQISSLAAYLNRTISHNYLPAQSTNAAANSLHHL